MPIVTSTTITDADDDVIIANVKVDQQNEVVSFSVTDENGDESEIEIALSVFDDLVEAVNDAR